MTLNTIHHEDNLTGMAKLPDNSIDCILTDPPYLYLKGQKLEREFDEKAFFKQCKRVLKKDGMIVLFGRGTSFYRWNTILGDLGFDFKEEIVWDKSYSSSPLLPVSRVHETVSIHSKGKGIINRSKVPYLEMKANDIPSICQDIKRLRSVFNNTKSLDAVLAYIENNDVQYNDATYKHRAVDGGDHGTIDRSVAVVKQIKDGMNEKSIVRRDYDTPRIIGHGLNGERANGDRCANAMQSIVAGLNEKTIIKQSRDHYATIHPTQKPVRLLERLLALTTKPCDVVLDPFSGSGSTAVACINTQRNYIGYEIDEEYYMSSIKRIDTLKSVAE